MRLNELVARDLSDYAIPELVRNQQLETNINAHIRGYTRIRTHITTKASAQASALDPCSAIHLRRCVMESLQPCSAIPTIIQYYRHADAIIGLIIRAGCVWGSLRACSRTTVALPPQSLSSLGIPIL